MDYTYTNLQKKVDMYSKGAISKNDLCIWSKKAYYDFLLEGFFYIEKIYAYPFVKKISTINVIPDDKNDVFPCSDHDLDRAVNVIKGTDNLFFTFRLSIPWKHNKMQKYKNKYNEYAELREKLSEIIGEKLQDDLKINIQLKALNNINIITVLDILEFKILNILRELTDEEQGIIYCGHINDLYYNKENQYGTNNLINILIKYIDCFIGMNGTIIEISYYKGKPHINAYPDNYSNS